MASGSISTLGVGSGLELQSILDQLREVDQQIIERKKGQITGFEARVEEFTVTKNRILDLRALSLDLSLSSTYLARSVSNSDGTVLSATAMDGVAVQGASITVERLASKSAWLADGQLSRQSVVSSEEGIFSYQIGDGAPVNVTVAAGTTLSQLADLINSGNGGAVARVIDNGDPGGNRYQLLLQSQNTGSANSITVLSTPGTMVMGRKEDSAEDLDARLLVDNVTYTRQSNTFNDILPGVTLTLQKTGSASVSVAADNSLLSQKITKFVEGYSSLVQELKKNTAYNAETKEFGVLAGTSMRDLPYELQNLMTRRVLVGAGGVGMTMFDLGVEFNRDGSITLNAAKLTSAISENMEGVKGFFLGDSEAGITGFADQVNDSLRTLTSGIGLIEAEKSAAKTRIRDLQLKIEAETERLDRRYEILTKQFVALDSYMSQMTSMSNYLSSQFDSLSSMLNGGGSKK